MYTRLNFTYAFRLGIVRKTDLWRTSGFDSALMENRADTLRDALEDQILTGQLAPGTRLEEMALAEQFGVSRTPIREALFQLAATGLVEHHARRGAFVASVGPRRLSEMFEVIAELEALCAHHAARRATMEDLRDITAAHLACAEAAASGDADSYYYANAEFHEQIRKVSGNAFLLEEIDRLQKRLKGYRRLQLRARDRVRNSFDEHSRIVAAIESGTADEAAAAMRAHVAVQGERFADLMATVAREDRQNANRTAAE
jgi:DNA-binding GntR family transcriptional regulator